MYIYIYIYCRWNNYNAFRMFALPCLCLSPEGPPPPQMLEMNFWTSVSFASSPTLPLPRIQCCDQTSCVACCTCCTTSDIPSLATLNLGERGLRAERSTHARKVNRIKAYQIWGGGGPSGERQRQGSANMREAV